MFKFLRNSVFSKQRVLFCRKMSEGVIVSVQQGKILGEQKVHQNCSFLCFKGIPYAKPPIGDLRFKAPQPLKKFEEDVLDCRNERDVSFHKDPFSGEFVGSENCLFLNVYTPTLKRDKALPVMVWIHGGAFSFGSGNSDFYYPRFLMEEDVIVVTLNYRLGMFGFLSHPKFGIPGNAALKDQLMALEWVKNNIHQFSGDPNNITLFGQSAGAACIHLHLLSEKSKKYFNKAILQSGTAINEWAMQMNPEYKVKRLAELMGFKGPDNEIMNFILKTENTQDIFKHLLGVLTQDERRRGLPIPFKPVVEKASDEAIITESPLKLLKKTNSIDKPVMMGYTSAEGITMLANALKKLDQIDADLVSLVPRSINLELDKQLPLASKIRKFYFKDGKIDKNSLEPLKDLLSDYHFIIGLHTVAEIHARYNLSSPLYFYKFSYVGELNFYKKIFQLETLKGACHGDELCYIFQMAEADEDFNQNDKNTITNICKLWSNFAKYSNPTPQNDSSLNIEWQPIKNVQNDEEFTLDFLNIDSELKMEANPEKERIDFWKAEYEIWNKSFLKPKL